MGETNLRHTVSGRAGSEPEGVGNTGLDSNIRHTPRLDSGAGAPLNVPVINLFPQSRLQSPTRRPCLQRGKSDISSAHYERLTSPPLDRCSSGSINAQCPPASNTTGGFTVCM
jgi:hypothetical protein